MSLSRKFTWWTIGIVAIAGLLAIILYYNHKIEERSRIFESVGGQIGLVLEQGLDHHMMSRDYGSMSETIRDMEGIESIDRISLVDGKGIVRMTSDRKAEGSGVDVLAAGCSGCHRKKEGMLFSLEGNSLQWVQHVTNKPKCFGCHDRGSKYNGVFVIKFRMPDLEQHIREEFSAGLLIFFSLIALIGISMIMLTRKVVVEKLTAVIATMKTFTAGDYGARVAIEGEDEIQDVARNFNEMAVAITERDREKEVLYEGIIRSQKEWRDTFDNITDLIFIMDRDFMIARANRAFAEYFGYSPRDIVGKSCAELFESLSADGEDRFCSMLDKEGPVTRDVHIPGRNRIFRISSFAFQAGSAEAGGIISIARDITEEKEKEMRLIINERLAALGQMASGIAHEINNPIASIAGCAEGLLKRLRTGRIDPALLDEYLNIIVEETGRCKGITTSMLSFVRTSTYETRRVSVRLLIERTLELLGYQGRLKDIHLVKEFQDGLPDVQGNEGELRQLFLILIVNALDAMEDRGSLTISSLSGEQEVLVTITDTGPGIPADVQSRIFDPFFTTKSDKGGTGLGLAIANRIIAGHNGTIRISSEPGAGATVTVTLPI